MAKIDLRSACVAQWRMNDNAASTVVLDAIGTANGVSLRNTSLMHADGKVNGCLDFNGSDGVYVTACPSMLWKSPFALSLWIKVPNGSFAGTGEQMWAVVEGEETSIFYFEGTTTHGAISIGSPGGGRTKLLYLDGVQVDSLNDMLTGIEEWLHLVVNITDSDALFEATGSIEFGYSLAAGSSNFTGKLDDIRLFNRPLTQAEIDFLYNDGAGTEQLAEKMTLTISAGPGGSVTSPGEGGFAYEPDSIVPVVASAAAGRRFSEWTGTAVAAGKVADARSASTLLTLSADYTVSAVFAPDLRQTELAGEIDQVIEEILSVSGTELQYLPSVGDARTISAFVDYGGEGAIPGLPHGTGPGISVLVRNHATAGIASEAVDCGGDAVYIAGRQHEAPRWRRLTKIIFQNASVLILQVQ